MEVLNGRIMHALSGFYYVQTEKGLVECRAKGAFRNIGTKPLVGDFVSVEYDGKKGTVAAVAERKNFLFRPPVANLDTLIIISSVVQPAPNMLVIDKMTALAEKKDIEVCVLFSKSDMASADEYTKIYQQIGINSFAFSSKTGENTEKVAKLFDGKTCALTGNSGVGKSSLLNCLDENLKLRTAEISTALGRGKHTTRDVRLYPMLGGFIADTPGFSSLDFEDGEVIYKDSLPYCFPEFVDKIPQCLFGPSCSHAKDKGCAVRAAADEGLIPRSRYDSYLQMLDEVKDIKEWEKK